MGVRQISSRKSDIRDKLKKYFVIRVTLTSHMGGLSGQFGHLKCVDHTNKISINIS
jgi:hypothetical protein